jgi:hypothetical protein
MYESDKSALQSCFVMDSRELLRIKHIARSEGETNLGATSLAAPNAASSSVAKYSLVNPERIGVATMGLYCWTPKADFTRLGHPWSPGHDFQGAGSNWRFTTKMSTKI